MYVRLNLATQPLISHRRFFAGSAALAALGLLLFLGFGWRFYVLRKADESFRARSSKIQAELNEESKQRAELEKYFAQLQARSVNWTQMFMDLEKMLPPGVHVLHIDPKLDKGVVSVHFIVGATNQEAKLKLLKAFEDSPAFAHVVLLSEKAETRPGSDPLTIEFVAEFANT